LSDIPIIHIIYVYKIIYIYIYIYIHTYLEAVGDVVLAAARVAHRGDVLQILAVLEVALWSRVLKGWGRVRKSREGRELWEGGDMADC
jgi:hypothetical protein